MYIRILMNNMNLMIKEILIPWNDNNTTRFETPTIYGGDCYIGRYNEKVIMPFFWDFMLGQPDGFPYDYKLRANVPRPIYWMDTKKYELSELTRQMVWFLTGLMQVYLDLTLKVT